MEAPKIEGYDIQAALGAGATGTVYRAERADGKLCAVKVFDTMACNLALLENRIDRIHESVLSGVTMPIWGQSLDARPAFVAMPLVEKNLQLQLDDYIGTEKAWPLVLKLAEKISQLHRSRVAHGNLKPGHLFFDTEDELLLADYASGLMPGVHHLGYTDALLYAAPEQLRNLEGYLDEAGYRWDVFAFGVLAFRLLNGNFPRCDELFQTVSPKSGTTERFRLEADYEGIAVGLESAHLSAWKNEPVSEVEKRQRHIIEHCLALNPLERPSDMMEVARQFSVIHQEITLETERIAILTSEKKAHRRRKTMTLMSQIFGVTALCLGGIWQFTQHQRDQEKLQAQEDFDLMEEGKDTEISQLNTELAEAKKAEDLALKKQKEIQTSLDTEQEKSRDELLAAQMTSEQLMDWVLEKGIPGVPTLEGRKGRLQQLAAGLRKQLVGLGERKGLEKQASLIRLRLAEIYLASGQREKGQEALMQALDAGKDHLAAEQIARASLRYLLLTSRDPKQDIATLESVLAETEAEVEKAWANKKSSAEKLRAQGALFLVKGRIAEKKNDAKQALTDYYAALKSFQKLSKRFPESPALYFTLGRAYLTAGRVAEGAGAIDDAATLTGYAAQQFLLLSKKEGGKTPEIAYQIASATAAKAVTQWQQGKTFEAAQLAEKGLGKLSALAVKMPDDFRVITDLASQQGIVATALRDEGKARESSKLLRTAIQSLELGLEKHPEDLEARYLLASLKWQMCGLLGQQGAGEDELELGLSARDLLREILAEKKNVPHPYLVRKSLAYLCGDLGHSADLHGDRQTAAKLLRESISQWEELLRLSPNSPENIEGISWAREQLAALGE